METLAIPLSRYAAGSIIYQDLDRFFRVLKFQTYALVFLCLMHFHTDILPLQTIQYGQTFFPTPPASRHGRRICSIRGHISHDIAIRRFGYKVEFWKAFRASASTSSKSSCVSFKNLVEAGSLRRENSAPIRISKNPLRYVRISDVFFA